MTSPAKPKRGRPPKGDRPMTSTERAAASRAKALEDASKPKGTIEALVAEWRSADAAAQYEFLTWVNMQPIKPTHSAPSRATAPPGSLLKGQK